MAENILDSTPHKDSKPRRPGRNLDISDGRLQSTREHLVWLIETTWYEVGEAFPSLKSPAEVPLRLRIWQDRSSEYVVTVLLRPSTSPATGKVVNETRRRYYELNGKLADADEVVAHRSESLQRAMRIPTVKMSEGEQFVLDSERDQLALDEEIRNRVVVLVRAARDYLRLKEQLQTVEALLHDREAYFARAELIDFCKSNRYRFIPLNVANALAGFPFIGWRQSMKRCNKWKSVGAMGTSYQVFLVIRKIVDANTRRSELVSDGRNWLERKRPEKSLLDGILELRQQWYYLRRSIQRVLEAGVSGMPRHHLPFAIAKEYWRRRSAPSPVDIAFAEEQRLQE